jgi:predicted DNA-binding antitoxin AbrB/MazE fold protein
MSEAIAAIFDGTVFHPIDPVSLPANTSVKITIEALPASNPSSRSFLQTARSLNLEGPSDWSVHLNSYLDDTPQDQSQASGENPIS